MAFDIEGARSAGYSDGEIAGFLGQQSGFDVGAAQKAGYSHSEIVGFLSQKQEKTAAPSEPVEPLGDPMGSGASEIMAQPTVTAKTSVLEGDTTLPPDIAAASKIPVRPEVRAAITSQWDSATPAQRAKLEAKPGWTGQLARERSGLYERQDAGTEGMPANNAQSKFDTRVENRPLGPHATEGKATYRQKAEDYVRSLMGLAASSEAPDQKAAAQAWILSNAKRDNISVDSMREAVGGMRPELDQFVQSAIDAGTLGMVRDNTMPAEGLPQVAAKGLGNLAGFIAGPASVAGLGVGAVTKGALVADVADSFGTRIAKTVLDQAATLGLATTIGATGRALDTTSASAASKVFADANASGQGMGAVFGGAGRLIPGSGVGSKVARIAGINVGMDALQGTNPMDDRPTEQKIFDYGLNTYFALHGGGKVAGGDRVAAAESAKSAALGKWDALRNAEQPTPDEPVTPEAARVDPIAKIAKATSVDEAIAAAQEAVATPKTDAILNIRPLKAPDVSASPDLSAVDTAAGERRSAESRIGVESELGDRGAERSAVDAGELRPEPESRTAPLADGGEQVAVEAEPARTDDAGLTSELHRIEAKRIRQSAENMAALPDVAQRYRDLAESHDLAADRKESLTQTADTQHFKFEQNPGGTLTVRGDKASIREALSHLPDGSLFSGKDGVTVNKTDAERAQRLLSEFDPTVHSELNGKKVRIEVTADDGTKATLKLDAGKAMRAVDMRERELDKLRECVGRA